jgi:hypothetical protein
MKFERFGLMGMFHLVTSFCFQAFQFVGLYVVVWYLRIYLYLKKKKTNILILYFHGAFVSEVRFRNTLPHLTCIEKKKKKPKSCYVKCGILFS